MRNEVVKRKKILVKFEKRLAISPVSSLGVLLISVILALLLGAIFVKLNGFDPWKVYKLMFSGALPQLTGYRKPPLKLSP